MAGKLRKTGIDVIGDVSWGKHVCHFYQTKEDLLDILVPYFKAGLENNEFCMWVTSEPLGVEEAKTSLKKVAENLDSYIDAGQIEILDASQWYTKSGKFDSDQVLQGWVEKEVQALERGFDGLRLSGNTFWLKGKDWKDFADYEATIGGIIGSHRMLAMCSYSLGECSAADMIDGVNNHHSVIIRREGKWEILESAQRKRVEEALQESEQKLVPVFDSIAEGVCVTDLYGNVAQANKALFRLFGFDSREEILGRNAFKFISEKDRDRAMEDVKRMLEVGQIRNIEYTFLRKDGTEFDADLSNAVLRDVSGNVVGAVGITSDIAKRRQAEVQLKEERDRAQKYLDVAGVVLLAVEADLLVSLVNGNGCKILGYEGKEIIGKNWVDTFIPEGMRDKVKAVFEQLMAGEIESVEYCESPVLTRSGEEKTVAWYSTALKDEAGKGIAVLSSGEDVTERKRMEKALRESEERFRNIYAESPIGIELYDADGQLVNLNKACLDIFGISSVAEIRGFKLFEDPNFPDEAKGRLRKGKTVRYEAPFDFEKVKEFELYKTTKSGIIYLQVVCTPFGLKGKASSEGYLVQVQDITERKAVDRALAEERKLLEATLRSTADGVITTDVEGRVVLMNKVAEELTGWTEKQAVGKHLGKVFHIIDQTTREEIENPMERMLQSDGVIGAIDLAILVDRDGTERITSTRGAPIRDEDGNLLGAVLVFHDITPLRTLEEELQKVAKLEAIGILAGGIAHDFNNILAGIIGNIGLAKTYVEPRERVFDLLLEAEKASWRATDLTQQLLTFAKSGVSAKIITSLEELIRDSASFALRGSNVRCDFSLSEDLWSVEVNGGQISQVISNLVINADEAMPEGGVVKIRAQNVTVTARDVLPLPEGDYVKITVEDHGVGISKAHLAKIFDPYFTTTQKGTGLGLTTAYSIVKKHGGHITVKSRLGVGTTFFVYLPPSEKPVPVKSTEVETHVARGKRILVMDDEEIIRKLLRRMLTDIGYDVEVAREGAEAVKLYVKAEESGQPFDAVILDLTVPGGVGGKETLRQLLEIAPSVKVIVSSGYSTDPIIVEFREYGFKGVVAKPYQVSELRETVRRVIMGTGE